MEKVGIEAIHFDIPKIYLPIEELAKARGIEADKLRFGLGLERMSFPDFHQDAVVFGANAAKRLIEKEQLRAQDIDRIYVGTESSVDGSKPIASYLLSMIENCCFEKGSLSHVDVVDLTFACIGGVDALQNSLDFIKANPSKKAIVICCDTAKYDLESTGEYTQGAGAVALLLSANPSLIEIKDNWSVSTEGVFDFFKPRRQVLADDIELKNHTFSIDEAVIEIFREQPVFDGQYSNQCYKERTSDAYFQLKNKNKEKATLYEQWEMICMHLPYCFQARRIFTEIFIEDNEGLKQQLENSDDAQIFTKTVSKSDSYKSLVKEKIYPTEIASGKIGNMYTASIFMGLLSALSFHFENDTDLAHQKIGFLAYGSGSKSKAFEGVVQANWKRKMEGLDLFKTIENATAIDIETYVALHQLSAKKSVLTPSHEFVLEGIENEKPHLVGARYYKYIDTSEVK